MANFLSDWWYGDSQKDAINQATDASNANAAKALTAQEKANKESLDFQKILTYLQAQMGNQSNAQSLAATLGGQQQGLNQFAQMYNQEQTNKLPWQMSSLAALQALGPLMQMTGLQGYQSPTSLDTTKMVAPDVMKDFTALSDYFQKTGQQQMNPQAMLSAFNDPAGYLAAQKTGWPSATGTSAPVGASNYPPMTGNELLNQDLFDRFKVEATQDWIKRFQESDPTRAGNVLVAWRDAMAAANKAPTIPSLGNMGGTGTGGSSGSGTSGSGVGGQTTSLQPMTSTYNALAGNPEYDYLHSQAQRTLANALAAKGMSGSGAAAKMQTDTTLGMARDEMDRRRKQLTDIYGLALGQVPQGQTQAGQTMANMLSSGGQNTAQALTNAAQQRSGLYSNLGNAASQAAQNTGQSLGGYYNALTQNNMNRAQAMQGVTTGADQLWSLGKFALSGGLSGGTTMNPLNTKFWGY